MLNEQISKISIDMRPYGETIMKLMEKDSKKDGPLSNADRTQLMQQVKGMLLLKHPTVRSFEIIEHYHIPEGPAEFFAIEKDQNLVYGFAIYDGLAVYTGIYTSGSDKLLVPGSPFVHKKIGDMLKHYSILGMDNIIINKFPETE